MRILLITSTLPWPLRRNGGGQRSALLRRALQRWGEVDVLGVGGTQLVDKDVTDQMLVEHGIQGCFIRTRAPEPAPPPWWAAGPLRRVHDLLENYRGRFQPEPAAVEWLEERMADPRRRYDLIVGRYLAGALQGGAGTRATRGIPMLLDFDDVDWQTLAAAMAYEPWSGINGMIGASLVLREVRRICLESLSRFRHVWVTSAEDAALLPSDAPPHSLLPNIPYADRYDVEPDAPPNDESATDVLFVGDLQLPANREGLERYIVQSWPQVREAVPTATLRIVGRGLRAEQRERWSQMDGVDVIGYAPDLSDAYARAALCIVPTFFGGGTKIKVLEALLMNRPVVTTEHALRGYRMLNLQGPSVWIADDDAGFADGSIKLLKDPALRREMAARGRAAVLREFSWERFQHVVNEAVAPLLPRGAAAEPPPVGLTVSLPA